MTIKTEKFVKDGIPMVREYIGPNEDLVTSVIERGESLKNTDEVKPLYEDTENQSLEYENMNTKLMAQLLLNQAMILKRMDDLEAGKK